MQLSRHISWNRYFILGFLLYILFITCLIIYKHHDSEEVTSHEILELYEELKSLKQRDYEKMQLLIEYSPGLDNSVKDKFMKRLKNVYKDIGSKNEPTLEYELLRRRLHNNVLEMWNFITDQAKHFKCDTAEKEKGCKLENFMQLINEFKRSLIKDVDTLASMDGYENWRQKENENLSKLVQNRLIRLQNPTNCDNAKKLVCDLNKGCGYGCQLHHLVYCFIVAYGTERTLILRSRGWRYSHDGWEKVFLPVSDNCVSEEGSPKMSWPGTSNTQILVLPIIDSLSPRPSYLPLSIPEDLSDRIRRIHGDPFVWWVGQFLKYLLRPQPETLTMLNSYKEKFDFKSPVVGVHIRRTDKVGTEAAYHSLKEYMIHVEEYFSSLLQPGVPKRVYIATDDPKIFAEARKNYPQFIIMGDESISQSAAVKNRYSQHSLSGIITDIHLLSLTDYLVCTFSSQVCRVAYEIMNNLRPDAANRFRSLDDIYYYGGQKGRYQKVVLNHTPMGSEEIELKVGDKLSVAGNHWNGFSKGTNLRTYKTGLYPTFKVIPDEEIVPYPKYSHLEEM